jgi:hypothetical protein
MGMQKIDITKATDAELRLYATLVQGLAIKAGANRETILAKLKQVWDADYIVLSFDTSEQAGVGHTMEGAPPKNPNPGKPSAAVIGGEQKEPRKWTKEEIEQMAGSGIKEAPSNSDPRVTIVLAEGQGQMGKEPAFVSVNGRGILIPRRRQVSIAYRYYLILKDSITDEVTQNFEEERLDVNEVARFPMQIVKLPTEEEIKAWDDLQARAAGQQVAA